MGKGGEEQEGAGSRKRRQATGQTYEREFIAQWLRTKQTDPISNARLPNKKLVPNFAPRGLILQRKETHPECTG